MATAVEAAEHIADGHARFTPTEQRHLYRGARRALLRLETQIAIARHAELLSAGTQHDLLARIQVVHRLLSGYLVYLERQIEDSAESAARA
jgi:hypothetical protein